MSFHNNWGIVSNQSWYFFLVKNWLVAYKKYRSDVKPEPLENDTFYFLPS